MRTSKYIPLMTDRARFPILRGPTFAGPLALIILFSKARFFNFPISSFSLIKPGLVLDLLANRIRFFFRLEWDCLAPFFYRRDSFQKHFLIAPLFFRFPPSSQPLALPPLWFPDHVELRAFFHFLLLPAPVLSLNLLIPHVRERLFFPKHRALFSVSGSFSNFELRWVCIPS